MALAAIARANRPQTPHAYKLLLPRNPRVSAVLLHRSPIIRYKAGESLKLTSVPRLAKLFPHAADGKERTILLKRKIQRERRVVQDHFKHLRSRTFVRGRQQPLVRLLLHFGAFTCSLFPTGSVVLTHLCPPTPPFLLACFFSNRVRRSRSGRPLRSGSLSSTSSEATGSASSLATSRSSGLRQKSS